MMISRFPNTSGLKVGDVVKLEMTEKQQVAASAAIYLIPLAFAAFGYAFGALFITKFISFGSQTVGIIMAFIAFAASFFVVAAIERNQQQYFAPKVVKKS